MNDRRSTSLDRTIDRWLATFASANTRQAYRRDLDVYRSWLVDRSLDIDAVDGRDVEAFRAACESEGASAATVNRRVAAIASFYRFANARASAPNPTEGVARRTVVSAAPVALSAAQADRVWKSAAALGSRTSVIVGLVMLNGWKAHEVLAVDAGTVTLDRRAVRIGTGAPLDPRTASALRAHLGQRTDGPLLFGENPTRESARLTRFGVDYLVKRVGAHAGLDDPLTVNILRATHQSLDAGSSASRATR